MFAPPPPGFRPPGTRSAESQPRSSKVSRSRMLPNLRASLPAEPAKPGLIPSSAARRPREHTPPHRWRVSPPATPAERICPGRRYRVSSGAPLLLGRAAMAQ
jgi:hypothetical protein